MSCGLEQDLLQRFHDEECSPAERDRVLSHLASCPSCRSLVEDWHRVDDWTRVLLDEETGGTVPTELVRGIEAALPPTLPVAPEGRGLSIGSLVLATLAFMTGVFAGRPLVENRTGWLSPRGAPQSSRGQARRTPVRAGTARPEEKSSAVVPSESRASTAPRPTREALLHELALLTEAVTREAEALSRSGEDRAVLRAFDATDRRVLRKADRLSLAASTTTSETFFERHGAFKAWVHRLPPETMETLLPPGSRPGALLTLYYVNDRKAFERLDESLRRLAELEDDEAGPHEDAPRLLDAERLSRGTARRWFALQEETVRLLAAERAGRAWTAGTVSVELAPPLPRRGDTIDLAFVLGDRPAAWPFPKPRDAVASEILQRRGNTWRWGSTDIHFRGSFEIVRDGERLSSIEIWLLPRTDAPPALSAFRREAHELDALLRMAPELPPSSSPRPRPRPRAELEWIDPAGERSALLFTVQLPARWSATFELMPKGRSLLDVPAADGHRTRSLVVAPVETEEPVRVDGLFADPEGHLYERSIVPRP